MPELPVVPVDLQDTEAMTAWATTASAVFVQPRPTADSVAARQERMAGHRLYAAMDGDRTVATFRSFDTHLTLPGDVEPLPVNAISSVTVLPTHRRRRLLTRWMTSELGRAADAGVAASILIASEAGIYERFGFGVATTACTWTVDALQADWRCERSGRVEIVTPQAYVDAAPAVYERARALHPGTIDRPDVRWRMLAQLVPAPSEEDRTRLFALHHGAGGDADGLLVYTVESKEEERVSRSRLVVHDLVAASDAAYADLWRFCADVDFVTGVVAEDRSPREPLPLLLRNSRVARNGAVSDFLWARLHDVPRALSSRRYAVPGSLVLQVRDALQQVEGRFRLDVDSDGTAGCEQVPESGPAADVELDASTLGQLWLGSGDLVPLARAGRVTASGPQALRRAQSLLAWPEPAWCGTWF